MPPKPPKQAPVSVPGHRMFTWDFEGKLYMQCECGWEGREWHFSDWCHAKKSHTWHLKGLVNEGL